jgi:hypothetical protein
LTFLRINKENISSVMKNPIITKIKSVFIGLAVLFTCFGGVDGLASAPRPQTWSRNANGGGNSLIVNNLILYNMPDGGLFSGYFAIAVGMNPVKNCSIDDACRIRKYVHKNLDNSRDCTKDTVLQDWKCHDIAKSIRRPIVVCGFNDINREKSTNKEFSEVFLPDGSSYYCTLSGANGIINVSDVGKLEIKDKKCLKGSSSSKITTKLLDVVNDKNNTIFLYENLGDRWSVGLWREANVPTNPSANVLSTNPLPSSVVNVSVPNNPQNNSQARRMGRQNLRNRRRRNRRQQLNFRGKKLSRRQRRIGRKNVKNESDDRSGRVGRKRRRAQKRRKRGRRWRVRRIGRQR